jgi:hypothetical protein
MADLPEILLQVEQPDGSFTCEGLNGVPAARKSWIALVSSGSPTSRQHAKNLADELRAILIGSSPTVRVEALQCPVPPAGLSPAAYPDRVKVLVLLGTPDSRLQDIPWYSTWGNDAEESFVMTVIPEGQFSQTIDASLSGRDDHVLNQMNAAFWRQAPKEVAPAVLSRAAVTSSSNRVFISYRRVETKALADQLYDALDHAGFDVFLDRYTVPVGYNFQRRLTQELEDKSMVVLLESKFLSDSQWTQHEIAFAKRNRLGLALIRMPDVDPAHGIASATLGPDIRLQSQDFAEPEKHVPNPQAPGATMSEWQTLKPEVLADIVARIKIAHAEALFHRRHALRGDLVVALNNAGVPTQYTAIGPLVVKTDVEEHLLWLTTRPPEVDDFQSIHTARGARTPPLPRGLIVGPQAAQEPDRKLRLTWLSNVTGCLSFDEGNLAELAQKVKSGRWD